MMISSILFMLILLIMTLLTSMLNIISMKTIIDREKSSPFECGFDPKSSARIPFSLQFFLIALIFLIFDIEISLLFPIILTIKSSNLMMYLISTIMSITIISTGLIHEWIQGALNWKK